MESSADPTNPTQTRLLSEVRDSANARAWADFHRIYAPMVGGFLQRMGLSDADVDDATQEILMVAHTALRDGSYDRSKGKFRGWLYGVARNKAKEAHRHRRRPSRARWAAAEGEIDLLSGLEDKSGEAEQQMWEQEWRCSLLAEAMRQVEHTLGQNVYPAFMLYAVQRMPVDEVAKELRISVSSVYVYKQRALEAIRNWVAQFEAEVEMPKH